MNHYTAPAAALLGASALLLFGTLKSFERAHQSAQELSAATVALRGARLQLASAQAATDAARRKTAPADKFLETWTRELTAESNIEDIFGKLDTLAVNNLLSPSGKNFGATPNYFFNGRKLPTQNVNLTVAGEYYRTLNWLGAAEAAFPLARVEQISYTTNANTLSLAVQFVFPRKFDSE
jgi:type II secretory pathway pseudopilin PulG